MYSKLLSKNIHRKLRERKRKYKHHKEKYTKKSVFFFFIFFLLIIFSLIVYLTNLVTTYSENLPSISTPFDRKLPESSIIYDNEGNILYTIFGSQNRIYIPLKKIPMNMRYATLAAEDINFYSEDGINPAAILRSATYDLFFHTSGESLQGASTITQQLVKYTSLPQTQTLERKVKEVIMTLKIVQSYSKDQILEAYLNAVPYGGNNYGVEAAARAYFNKDIDQLDLAQCAFLAGLPQAPSLYSPLFSTNPQATAYAINRQHYVLEQMLKYRSITHVTEEQIDEAENEPLIFNTDQSIKYPSFVLYIRDNILYPLYGKDAVNTQGFKIYTTLNSKIQDIGQSVITSGVKRNLAYGYNTHNASLVAINSTTGDLLAMIGSVDYNNTSPYVDGNVNMTMSGISPGSSIKPFVYLTAFEQGEDPNTQVHDEKTTFNGNYTPMDFDDKYEGPMPISQALLESRNIPAVETTQKIGLNNFYSNLIKLGYSSLGPIYNYGLSLGIGGCDISLLDHTAAYTVLSQDGVKIPVRSFTKIEDKFNNVKYDNTKVTPTRIFDKDKVQQLNGILKNYHTLWPVKSKGYVVAGKTGTSQDNKNNLFMGYSSTLAVGVWAGNTNQSYTTSYTFGENASSPIWNDFMLQVLPMFNNTSNF